MRPTFGALTPAGTRCWADHAAPSRTRECQDAGRDLIGGLDQEVGILLRIELEGRPAFMAAAERQDRYQHDARLAILEQRLPGVLGEAALHRQSLLAIREVPAAAGRWAEAVDELHRATEAVPAFAAAHEALAEAYLALRQAPFAEYHAEIALRLTAPNVPRFDDQLNHLLQLAVTPIRPRVG